ncbi:hypothetical protein [Natrialba swarupiae]|uniref:Uncharacterized protein n=1 Tax=Natrialba swarupiae TaxID=2448032 RepID=A0A5D5AHC8_9EURY|nr:hypothetical protein [Natrialba swarupiae]TYT60534.1 hypothetical protein FYC77_18365 [Natrialba swarupiae]
MGVGVPGLTSRLRAAIVWPVGTARLRRHDRRGTVDEFGRFRGLVSPAGDVVGGWLEFPRGQSGWDGAPIHHAWAVAEANASGILESGAMHVAIETASGRADD